MKKTLLCFLFIVVLLVAVQACQSAWAEVRNVSLDGRQVGDSLQLFVRWSAPPDGGPRRVALDGYEVRIVEVAGIDTVLSHSIGIQTADTLMMALPPLGDSITVYAAVATRDIDADLSPVWSLSNQLQVRMGKLPPLPPGPVTIDTMPEIVAWQIRTDVVDVLTRDSLQYCLMIEFADGTKAYSNWHFTDEQEAYCLTVYNRWLTEVEG